MRFWLDATDISRGELARVVGEKHGTIRLWLHGDKPIYYSCLRLFFAYVSFLDVPRAQEAVTPLKPPLPSYARDWLHYKGGWYSPPPEVVAGWISSFSLTSRQFGDIVGIGSERRIGQIKAGRVKMSYAPTRLFLAWSGLRDVQVRFASTGEH